MLCECYCDCVEAKKYCWHFRKSYVMKASSQIWLLNSQIWHDLCICIINIDCIRVAMTCLCLNKLIITVLRKIKLAEPHITVICYICYVICPCLSWRDCSSFRYPWEYKYISFQSFIIKSLIGGGHLMYLPSALHVSGAAAAFYWQLAE